MTEEQFKGLKIGDVVKFNSGGNKMTVTQVDDKTIAVVWHDDTGALHSKGGINYSVFELVTRGRSNITASLL